MGFVLAGAVVYEHAVSSELVDVAGLEVADEIVDLILVKSIVVYACSFPASFFLSFVVEVFQDRSADWHMFKLILMLVVGGIGFL